MAQAVRTAHVAPTRVLGACALAAAFILGRLSVPGPHVPVETEATRQADRISRELDEMEANLHATQGWVIEGQDLQRRHERVSALHCANATEQAELSARLTRDAASRRHRRTVDTGGGSDVGMLEEAAPAPERLAEARK